MKWVRLRLWYNSPTVGFGGVQTASGRTSKMTTILGNEDPFEEVERGIDWLER